MKKHVTNQNLRPCPFSNCPEKSRESENIASHLTEKTMSHTPKQRKTANKALSIKPPPPNNNIEKLNQQRRPTKRINSSTQNVVKDFEEMKETLAK